MGDRCSISITLKKEDLDVAREVLLGGEEERFEIEDENENGTVSVDAYEVNYGWYTEREELAKKIDFEGNHGNGGEYLASAFAAFGGKMAEAVCDNFGELLCTVQETRQGPVPELEPVERYIRVRDQFRGSLNGNGQDK